MTLHIQAPKKLFHSQATSHPFYHMSDSADEGKIRRHTRNFLTLNGRSNAIYEFRTGRRCVADEEAGLKAGEDVVEPAAKTGRRPEIRRQSPHWKEDEKLKAVVDFLANEWFIHLIMVYTFGCYKCAPKSSFVAQTKNRMHSCHELTNRCL